MLDLDFDASALAPGASSRLSRFDRKSSASSAFVFFPLGGMTGVARYK